MANSITKTKKIEKNELKPKYRFENTPVKSFKRLVILSDLHCGHQGGLTPEKWQYNLDNEATADLAKLQTESWNWYLSTVQKIGKTCDVMVVNGDLIDGRGERNGGAELITTDRLSQCAIAVECLQVWSPENIFITRGTPYHSGQSEQYEDIIAERLNAIIDDTIIINVNGKIFNFRHKVGGSSVPHGKATSALKESVWQNLKSIYNDCPQVDVVVRSHVHNFIAIQDSLRYTITTPALQVNSRYGKQQCTGYTDFGFIVIDVYDNGKIDIQPYISRFALNNDVIIKV